MNLLFSKTVEDVYVTARYEEGDKSASHIIMAY